MTNASHSSISTRLTLGFGCILVMLIALAAVGLISSLAVQKRMQEFTAVNAPKIKLANSMLSNASAMGIQSRSVVIRDAGFFKLARDQRVNF